MLVENSRSSIPTLFNPRKLLEIQIGVCVKNTFSTLVNFITYVAPIRLAVCFILRIWIPPKAEGRYTSISGFNEKLQSKICGFLLSVGERSHQLSSLKYWPEEPGITFKLRLNWVPLIF